MLTVAQRENLLKKYKKDHGGIHLKEDGILFLPKSYIQIIEHKRSPDPTEDEIFMTLNNRHQVSRRLNFVARPYVPFPKKKMIESPTDIESGG